MKKHTLLLLTILTLLTGCKKNKLEQQKLENKEISIDEKIKENGIYKLKCTALNNYDIIDINNNVILLSDGYAYQYLKKSGELYSNEEQCKKISDIKIKNIHNGSLIGYNDKIYEYINEELKESQNYEYKHSSIIDLFKDEAIRQIVPIEMTKEELEKYKHTEGYVDEQFVSHGYRKFLILKGGNIYETIYKSDYYYSKEKTKYQLLEEKIIYSKEIYGTINSFSIKNNQNQEIIIDKIASDKGYYELKEIETEQCKKYEDIKCEKELKLNENINKYKEDIKYLTVNYLITKNNSILNLEMNID